MQEICFTSVQSHVPVPPVLEPKSEWVLRRLLPFQRLSYQPQPLLRRTKEFFQREDLIADQILAQSVFVQVFKSRTFRLNPTEPDLRWLMYAMDTFFFSSLLTGDQDPLVRFEFGENIFKDFINVRKTRKITWGRARPEGGIQDWRMLISVEASTPWVWEGCLIRRTFKEVLETLVHEMAHAYLGLFSCLCWSCRMEIGPSGHGHVWRELKEAMYMTIRGWDPSLWDFYINDTDESDGTFVAFTNFKCL